MRSTDEPIVITQSFSVAKPLVWQAITNLTQMQAWFFAEIPKFEPVVGFETEFNISCHGNDYLHVWKTLNVASERRMVFDWSYQGIPGRGLVTWELDEADVETTLTLTSRATESFPQDDSAFHRESALAGWQILINERLAEHLTGG